LILRTAAIDRCWCVVIWVCAGRCKSSSTLARNQAKVLGSSGRLQTCRCRTCTVVRNYYTTRLLSNFLQVCCYVGIVCYAVVQQCI
jgi:hypothetical protein